MLGGKLAMFESGSCELLCLFELANAIGANPVSCLSSKIAVFDRFPLRTGGDFDKRAIDGLFERAMLGQRDRHKGWREKNARHENNFREARGDQVPQRALAIDDSVRLAIGQ